MFTCLVRIKQNHKLGLSQTKVLPWQRAQRKTLYFVALATVKVYSWVMLQAGMERKVFSFFSIVWFNTRIKGHKVL